MLVYNPDFNQIRNLNSKNPVSVKYVPNRRTYISDPPKHCHRTNHVGGGYIVNQENIHSKGSFSIGNICVRKMGVR